MKLNLIVSLLVAGSSLSAFAASNAVYAPTDATDVKVVSVEVGKKLDRIDVVADPSCEISNDPDHPSLCSGYKDVPVYSDAVVVTVSYNSESEGQFAGKLEGCTNNPDNITEGCVKTNTIDKEIYVALKDVSDAQMERVKAGDTSVVSLSQATVSVRTAQNAEVPAECYPVSNGDTIPPVVAGCENQPVLEMGAQSVIQISSSLN